MHSIGCFFEKECFLVQFTGVEAAYPYSAFEANDFKHCNLKRIIKLVQSQRSRCYELLIKSRLGRKDYAMRTTSTNVLPARP